MTNPFAELDLANAPDDPFAPPMGTNLYRFKEFDSFKGKKNPEEVYLTFKFMLDGSTSQNWKPIVGVPATLSDPDRKVRARSDLKKILLGLGVPSDELDEMSPEKIEAYYDTEVYVTLAKSGDYINLKKIVPASEVPDGVAGVAPTGDDGAPDLSGLAEFG